MYENLVFFGLGTGSFSHSAHQPLGKVVALHAETGDIVWEFDTTDVARNIEIYSSPIVANGQLYIGSSDRYRAASADR